MKTLLKPATYALILVSSFAFVPVPSFEKESNPVREKKPVPKIQVAVLLDVSNSMDGLINQAKAQLWNMVSVLGRAQCGEVTPTIEIALYEYGRSSNNPGDGYVKQINGFTGDLDQVSKNLFSLTTHGGSEFCGHVMYNSLTQMNWDTLSQSYKVIFIAGNEDFLQGDVSFTKACEEARKRNVIINTVYCGNKMQGIQEHWNLGSECGIGSFTNINQDAALDDIATPYDSTLFVLNDKLNRTYVGYGDYAASGYAMQAQADKENYKLNKAAAAKRVSVKSNNQLYSNGSWDMVDAQRVDTNFVFKINGANLPDSLRNKKPEELKKIIATKDKERSAIQQQIAGISIQREEYIKTEKTKNAQGANTPTLESEIEKIIRQQAAKYNMVIK